MPTPDPERDYWRTIEREKGYLRHGPRFVGAVLLPVIVSFFSIEAALVLAIPCAYVIALRDDKVARDVGREPPA